ncbi:helix-turn-helix transcriptional regulator [Bengtsoniella intestinalis]|uniref:helix-turn-helix domain-containing protein n=1 Tax=Bengtsoniella intestinalis TaxID=3073143 RepID=UPI00391F5228
MPASYNNLWKLLIDRNMKKKDLMAITGLSQATIGKLGRNETVKSDVLIKICESLGCDIGDIMEITKLTD